MGTQVTPMLAVSDGNVAIDFYKAAFNAVELARLPGPQGKLMHGAVRHGYYLRSQYPFEQTLEVLRRFNLHPTITPFSRCLRCNASLEPVLKERVIDQLEPLTKIYYQKFRRCSACHQVYWSGSHFEKLEARIAKLRQAL